MPLGLSLWRARDTRPAVRQQMRDYGRRFANLEERVQQRLKEIESEVARKLSASESNSKT
jgi:hypothetical protein